MPHLDVVGVTAEFITLNGFVVGADLGDFQRRRTGDGKTPCHGRIARSTQHGIFWQLDQTAAEVCRLKVKLHLRSRRQGGHGSSEIAIHRPAVAVQTVIVEDKTLWFRQWGVKAVPIKAHGDDAQIVAAPGGKL